MASFEEATHLIRWCNRVRNNNDSCGNISEAQELVLFHVAQQILIIFGLKPDTKATIRRSWRVAASAVVYFRRFYCSQQQLTVHDPRLIMLCCIFLAGKVEESFISMNELLQLTSSCFSSADVIRKESELLEAMRFDLYVHHPQNIIHSLLGDWKIYYSKKVSLSSDQKLHLSSLVKLLARYSEYLVGDLLTTEACIQFTPLEIALHALAYTVSDSMFEEFQSSFGMYLTERCGSDQVNKLLNRRDRFEGYIDQVLKEFSNEERKKAFAIVFYGA
jgi:hypothetical protein